MSLMEHSTVGQPAVSGATRTDDRETDAAERIRRIGHTKLPGLGSGPVFPFSGIFSWISSRFKRVTSSHEAP
jgi:hypothetical protein